MREPFDRDAACAALVDLLSEGVDGARARERSEFDRLVEGKRDKLVLFGAGNLGRATLRCLRQDGMEPVAFSDNDPEVWGRTIDGLPVLPPNDAADRFGSSCVFLVTIWNAYQRFSNTKEQLASLRCRSVYPSPPLRWKYGSRIPPFPILFLDLPSNLHKASSDVMRAVHVWADDASRREYVAQIRLRLLGDLQSLRPPVSDQYAPSDIFRRDSQEVFVDCGAFDGDTVQGFISAWEGRFRSVHALEPNPVSFRRLVDYVGSLPSALGNRIHVRQVAIGDVSGDVRFHTDASVGGVIADDGDLTIDCHTLDEMFDREPVTYVKMDIEGHELRALRGGLNVISRYRPVLAVCAYHTQDHLWSIPLFVRDKLEDYRLFLRPHRPDGWDLIVYAVPRERLATEIDQ